MARAKVSHCLGKHCTVRLRLRCVRIFAALGRTRAAHSTDSIHRSWRIRGDQRPELRYEQLVNDKKPGRNDLCHCGSGKKYKRCHAAQDAAAQSAELSAQADARAAAAAAAAAEAEVEGGQYRERDNKAAGDG